MHIIEKISSLFRLIPERPDLEFEFYPLPFDKYVTIYNELSIPSNNYPLFQDVVADIRSPLLKRGIRILQLINNPNDPKLSGCHPITQFSYHQLNYLLRRSLCHISTDVFTNELAGLLGIPSVSLVGNRFAKISTPWFGKDDRNKCLSHDRHDLKPSFSLQEQERPAISLIRSETVSESVLSTLGIKDVPPYSTVFVGNSYPAISIEYIPNAPFFTKACENNTVNVRLDLHHDSVIAQSYASKYPHVLVTKKPLSLDFLRSVRPQNKGLVISVSDDDPDLDQFVRDARSVGFQLSFLIGNRPDHKLRFLGQPMIMVDPKKPDDYKFNPNHRFKSSKLYIFNGETYFSLAHVEKGERGGITNTVIDNPKFWNDVDFFKIFSIRKTI